MTTLVAIFDLRYSKESEYQREVQESKAAGIPHLLPLQPASSMRTGTGQVLKKYFLTPHL